MGLESRTSSPCLCDRHPSLISAHGLKTSEAVQGEAAAGFFSKNHDSSSQSLNPAAEKYQAFKIKTPFLSLRGSEATQAIHKKVDSSMDRHALQSKARDDKKMDSRKNEKRQKSPHTTQAEGFLMRKLCFTSAGEGILLGVNEQARAK